MIRPVVIRPKAERQLESMARWWSENRSHEQAERWYTGFMKAIRMLSQNASRYPLAAEDREFPFEVRELLYGLGKNQRIGLCLRFVPTWFMSSWFDISSGRHFS